MAVRNVKIDGAGLTVIPSTKGSILYVGDFGLLHEDPTNLSWDEANVALKIPRFTIGGDVFLERDAANTLAQRNGTNAQAFNIYNTYTDAGNYERFQVQASGSGSNFIVGAFAAGTGTKRDVIWDAYRQIFQTGGANKWMIDATGHLTVLATDNTLDIGASGANRPRTGYFGTSVVVDGAGTRNGFQLVGAASGSGPNLVTVGGIDANINFNLSSTGTGAIQFNTLGGGTTQFKVVHTASAVNYVQTYGAVTGGSPVLAATGTDADVQLRLTSKGAGSVSFYTAAESELQVLVTRTASATRWITLTGSNGGNPTIDVSAGALKLSAGTSDIQWGKANVALGGGAAPTLGTIGGAGPAAAAQRNWLRFLESDGTASFIPVWR